MKVGVQAHFHEEFHYICSFKQVGNNPHQKTDSSGHQRVIYQANQINEAT